MQTELRQIVKLPDLDMGGATPIAGSAQAAAELTLAAGLAGSVTDQGLGTIYVADCGWTVGQKLGIAWDGGACFATVTDADGDALTVEVWDDRGLPADSTAIVAAVAVGSDVTSGLPQWLCPANPAVVTAHADHRALVVLRTSSDEILFMDIAAGSMPFLEADLSGFDWVYAAAGELAATALQIGECYDAET